MNEESFGFAWRYKRDKIARKVLLNDNNKAGDLNMVDFKSVSISMKAFWVNKIYNKNDDTWAIIPNKYLENCENYYV